MGILDALRRNPTGQADAMRQTTSLTMAYLLEQNRQFEAYMREKVAELEARVAAQQARTMTAMVINEATPLPVAVVWTPPETAVEPLPEQANEPGLTAFDDFWDNPEAVEPVEAVVEPPRLDWQTALLGEASLPATAAVFQSEAEPATELTALDEPVVEFNLPLVDGLVEDWA
jgi:hypothetical protein